MLPDPRQGDALLAILETGSFELAGERLHISASAVSQRISAMEAAMGAPLLVRSRPCRPTAAGGKLVQYLRRGKLLEAEFLAELAQDGAAPLSLSLAVNHDTLATWLLPAVAGFVARHQILLDIALDDQDHTYALMESGKAMAAVSTEPAAMRGCVAQPLGAMRYHMLASPAFAAARFPHGLEREAARRAPMLVFDRKDALQARFMQRWLGLAPGSYPCHHVPDSAAFLHAIELGMGYGMLPELQYGERVARGALCNLAPQRHLDVALHWHSWRVQSPKLELLSTEVVAAARRCLGREIVDQMQQSPP